MYNAHHHTPPPIKLYKTKQNMIRALDERLGDVCPSGDQSCWLKQPFAVADGDARALARRNFKPAKPSAWTANKNTWLTNVDIESVMRQYADADKRFEFMGVHPIDFTNVYDGKCISADICALRLAAKKRSGTQCLGFVFNTDTHDKGGRHWISLFVGLRPSCANYGVFFYDSVAEPPPARLRKYMDDLHAQMKREAGAVGKKVPRLETNSERRQYMGSECGVYALLFLVRMRSEGFERVCRTMGTDRVTEKYRDIFFRSDQPPTASLRIEKKSDA
jgi:hypothetical protein